MTLEELTYCPYVDQDIYAIHCNTLIRKFYEQCPAAQYMTDDEFIQIRDRAKAMKAQYLEEELTQQPKPNSYTISYNPKDPNYGQLVPIKPTKPVEELAAEDALSQPVFYNQDSKQFFKPFDQADFALLLSQNNTQLLKLQESVDKLQTVRYILDVLFIITGSALFFYFMFLFTSQLIF